MVTPNRTSKFRKQIKALKRDKEKKAKDEQTTIISKEEEQERINKLKEQGLL